MRELMKCISQKHILGGRNYNKNPLVEYVLILMTFYGDLFSAILLIKYQRKLIKMRAELANLNHCAVPFLTRASAFLCWYYFTF